MSQGLRTLVSTSQPRAPPFLMSCFLMTHFPGHTCGPAVEAASWAVSGVAENKVDLSDQQIICFVSHPAPGTGDAGGGDTSLPSSSSESWWGGGREATTQ